MSKKTKLVPAAMLAMVALMASSCGPNKSIQFWTGFGANVQQILDPMLADFQSKTDIVLDYESKGGYDNLYLAISSGLTTKSYPNVALAYPDHMANYISSGILEPLDAYIDKAGVNLEEFVPQYLAENQDFGVYESGPYEGEPITYGLPFNKSTEVFGVNESFFDWAKTIDSEVKVPETWEEVRTVGLKLKTIMRTGDTRGASPAAMWGKAVASTTSGGVTTWTIHDTAQAAGTNCRLDFSAVTEENFVPFGYDSQSNFFITIVRQWGGRYTYTETKSGSTVGYYGFDSNECRQALAFFQDLAEQRIMGVPATWEETQYCSNPFKANKLVGVVGSSAGIYNQIGTYYKLGVHEIPYRVPEKKYVISQGTNIVMFTRGDAEQKSSNFELIKYLTSDPVSIPWCTGSGYFPVTTTAIASDEYQEFLATRNAQPRQQSVIDAAITGNKYGTDNWNQFVDPGFPGSTTIRTEVAFIMPNVMVNGRTVEESLDAVFAKLTQFKPVV